MTKDQQKKLLDLVDAYLAPLPDGPLAAAPSRHGTTSRRYPFLLDRRLWRRQPVLLPHPESGDIHRIRSPCRGVFDQRTAGKISRPYDRANAKRQRLRHRSVAAALRKRAAPQTRSRTARRAWEERLMPRALVIGGSVGGLMAGNLLRKIGWDVTIFERRPRRFGHPRRRAWRHAGVGRGPAALRRALRRDRRRRQSRLRLDGTGRRDRFHPSARKHFPAPGSASTRRCAKSRRNRSTARE